VHLKYLLDPLNLNLGLGQVRQERRLELMVGDLFDHLGKCLGDLLFRVVDVLEGVNEEIVQVLDRLREQTHVCLLIG
jgi:hypothetical protein